MKMKGEWKWKGMAMEMKGKWKWKGNGNERGMKMKEEWKWKGIFLIKILKRSFIYFFLSQDSYDTLAKFSVENSYNCLKILPQLRIRSYITFLENHNKSLLYHKET